MHHGQMTQSHGAALHGRAGELHELKLEAEILKARSALLTVFLLFNWGVVVVVCVCVCVSLFLCVGGWGLGSCAVVHLEYNTIEERRKKKVHTNDSPHTPGTPCLATVHIRLEHHA